MTPMHPKPSYAPKAILISIGEKKEPILVSLKQAIKLHSPEHVWFFCSAESQPHAAEALAEVTRAFAPHRISGEYLLEPKFEELNACYRTLRKQIPVLLQKYRLRREEVLVDFTGGTKSMSAALVLAATEFFQQFSYVGGSREKSGLGQVQSGEERIVYQSNPWSVLAVREVERAADFWKGLQYEAAADLLRHTAEQVPKKTLFRTFATLADAMAARHRLDLIGAKRQLEKVYDSRNESTVLQGLFDGRDDLGLFTFLEQTSVLMQKCMENSKANPTLLRELLDNALRTASQGRYEDAAARLYRGMEMQGQLWLKETSKNHFENGRCKKEKVESLFSTFPALDRGEWGIPDSDGRIKLGLERMFRCLAALQDGRAAAIVGDLDRGKGSKIREVTRQRNEGILAHGVNAVGETGFNSMKQIAEEFFELDLSREANPIPAFEVAWLEMQ